MTYSKMIVMSLTAFSFSMSACAAPVTSHNEKSGTYLKPGADITYSHNLKSKISNGETVTFKLTLNEAYDDGVLQVSLTPEGGIAFLQTASQVSFDMANGTTHETYISFVAERDGRHYINVNARAIEGSGNAHPRIFSIPVQVGPVTAQKPDPNMKTMDDGETLIEMDAQEEIK